MPPLRNKSEPEHNWGTFGECFIGLLPYIPHNKAPPECAWALGATLKETSNNYKQAEAPFVTAEEGVIRALCGTGSASTPSAAVAYFLGLRSAVLESFFLKLSVSRGPDTVETIIPFPSLPASRVAQWFLIDWWSRRGANEVAELRYLEAFLS